MSPSPFSQEQLRQNVWLSHQDVPWNRLLITQPLWGFASTDTLAFRRTTSAVGNLYFIDEEEIDLTKVLNAELPPVPQETSYTGIYDSTQLFGWLGDEFLT
jgi:hypothetical protein